MVAADIQYHETISTEGHMVRVLRSVVFNFVQMVSFKGVGDKNKNAYKHVSFSKITWHNCPEVNGT